MHIIQFFAYIFVNTNGFNMLFMMYLKAFSVLFAVLFLIKKQSHLAGLLSTLNGLNYLIL